MYIVNNGYVMQNLFVVFHYHRWPVSDSTQQISTSEIKTGRKLLMFQLEYHWKLDRSMLFIFFQNSNIIIFIAFTDRPDGEWSQLFREVSNVMSISNPLPSTDSPYIVVKQNMSQHSEKTAGKLIPKLDCMYLCTVGEHSISTSHE